MRGALPTERGRRGLGQGTGLRRARRAAGSVRQRDPADPAAREQRARGRIRARLRRRAVGWPLGRVRGCLGEGRGRRSGCEGCVPGFEPGRGGGVPGGTGGGAPGDSWGGRAVAGEACSEGQLSGWRRSSQKCQRHVRSRRRTQAGDWTWDSRKHGGRSACDVVCAIRCGWAAPEVGGVAAARRALQRCRACGRLSERGCRRHSSRDAGLRTGAC